MKKTYYIISENRTETFTIIAECNDGSALAEDLHGKEVWLFRDAIEYNGPHPHRIVSAYEVPYIETPMHPELPIGPHQYVHAGQIRDKRYRSMCARPYFRTY